MLRLFRIRTMVVVPALLSIENEHCGQSGQDVGGQRSATNLFILFSCLLTKAATVPLLALLRQQLVHPFAYEASARSLRQHDNLMYDCPSPC